MSLDFNKQRIKLNKFEKEKWNRKEICFPYGIPTQITVMHLGGNISSILSKDFAYGHRVAVMYF